MPPETLRAAFVAAAAPYLRAFHPLDGLCALLEETAQPRLDSLTLDVVLDAAAAGQQAWRALACPAATLGRGNGWCGSFDPAERPGLGHKRLQRQREGPRHGLPVLVVLADLRRREV